MTEPSAYVRRLPIGEPLSLPVDGVSGWDVFPYEGDIRVRALEQPTLPEPDRNGEQGPQDCVFCSLADGDCLWTDEHWRLVDEHGGLPAILKLVPRGHHDLSDLPPERAAELGPMLQRVERAVLSPGGIARSHVNRWGDGAAHLHVFFFARPEGMLQLRGSFLPAWDEALPPLPEEMLAENRRIIAQAMAKDGGTARV
ncbi:hypothetical protein DEJ50_15600 [Streptomyces venezuelae]|uniref:HIT family protein n=1 Tax=Streptomyces venezuelae TaxID=54571 RepID=A0A5P2D2Q8_STRVZ|nr:hypothetical protein [Streptomyces venezuelae]QES49023.1 hypothetical protein DEJ50_15600 [Streptomyces venezuelae]